MDVDPTETGDRDNPFDPVDPGDDDEGESIPMTSTSTRDRGGYGNHDTEETSFIDNWDDNTPLIQREENRDEAWERVKRKYPKVNPVKSPFTASLDKFDRVVVRLKRQGGKIYQLFKSDGEPNEKLPKTIKESLGPSAE